MPLSKVSHMAKFRVKEKGNGCLFSGRDSTAKWHGKGHRGKGRTGGHECNLLHPLSSNSPATKKQPHMSPTLAGSGATVSVPPENSMTCSVFGGFGTRKGIGGNHWFTPKRLYTRWEGENHDWNRERPCLYEACIPVGTDKDWENNCET